MAGAFLSAAMAVATGQANFVAVTRGVVQPLGGRYGTVPSFRRDGVPRGAFPVLSSPGQAFALAARRHMHEFGTTEEHFGEIAVNNRRNAVTNPDARFREPITLDDHRNSRMIADPLRLLDFCLESDVGACCIVTTAERARDLPNPPAYVAAAATGAPRRWGGAHFWMAEGGGTGYQMSPADFTSAGHRTIAQRLYRDAGIGPSEVDVALIYDHFTPMVLLSLEDYGFVPRGESGPFVAEGNIRRTGSLPVNTHGGNHSEVYAHGMTHVFEAVRQIRGTSPNQVDGAEVALVVGGASPAPSGSLIITKHEGRAA
ncbi:thiolase C-terminal domain-containing protein [Pseudonocardia sp. GCM10023141]|uniref:thiolase C-terminal domain-containing protein n=1 Tax=Pseudonocardia sp. GCM10023141 TaxID=3252653 RepID=UPI0036163481